MHKVILMTHIPETGAINWVHFSGVGFWSVCRVLNTGSGVISN